MDDDDDDGVNGGDADGDDRVDNGDTLEFCTSSDLSDQANALFEYSTTKKKIFHLGRKNFHSDTIFLHPDTKLTKKGIFCPYTKPA